MNATDVLDKDTVQSFLQSYSLTVLSLSNTLRKYLRKTDSRLASRCRIIIPAGDIKTAFSSGFRLVVAVT